MTPHIFNVSNIDVWKLKMSMYLKILGMHVYLAATKKSYFGNSKHIEANAQVLKALRASLDKKYLHVFSHYDSAFAVWNILTSLELPTLINKKRRSRRDESDEHCFMIQGLSLIHI